MEWRLAEPSRAGPAKITPGGRHSPCSCAVIMAIAMHDEGGNLFRLEIGGTLRKADLERCQSDLVKHIVRTGPVKLLFVLEGFDGWARGDSWNDLSFYIKHGESIKRIAIVGDERWRSEALMFAGADLRTAPVEFFPARAVADARTWLSA